MRYVLRNHDELVHAWGNQTQESGKSSSMFFEGTSLYSYGYHYKIAELFPDLNIVLWNANKSSATTEGKHKNKARRAIPHSYTVIEVPGAYVSNSNLQYFIDQINYNLTKAVRARVNSDWYQSQAANILGQAVEYCEAFDIELPEQIARWHNDGLLTEEARQRIAEAEQKRRANEIAENKERIENWINGRGYMHKNLTQIFLRVDPDDKELVETSWGAHVPLSDARKLYLAIMAGANVSGRAIGNYRVKSFDGNSLTIGCHKLSVKEINRFAETQHWTAVPQVN